MTLARRERPAQVPPSFECARERPGCADATEDVPPRAGRSIRPGCRSSAAMCAGRADAAFRCCRKSDPVPRRARIESRAGQGRVHHRQQLVFGNEQYAVGRGSSCINRSTSISPAWVSPSVPHKSVPWAPRRPPADPPCRLHPAPSCKTPASESRTTTIPSHC